MSSSRVWYISSKLYLHMFSPRHALLLWNVAVGGALRGQIASSKRPACLGDHGMLGPSPILQTFCCLMSDSCCGWTDNHHACVCSAAPCNSARALE